MRLYSRMNAQAVDDPEFGHFDLSKEHGGFDFPDVLSDRVERQCVKGKRMWETEIERDERLHGEESARRRDPETLYNAVAQIADLGKQMASAKGGGAGNAEVATLAKQVEALTAKLAAMEGKPVDGETPDDGAGETAGTKTPAKAGRAGKAAGN